MKTIAMMAALSAGTALAMPRAVQMTPQAKTTDPVALIGELNAAFEEFKATNDKAVGDKVDAVVTAKIETLNAAMTAMQTEIDVQARVIAAQKSDGKGIIGDLPASEPGYIDGFKAYMRKGDEAPMAALKKATDAEGGYFAPIEWDRTITSKLKRISAIRANARVMNITTAGFKKDFSDRVIGSGWVGETAARPETTTPGVTQLDFTPGEIYANPAVTQGLLDDAAFDVEQWLADEVDVEFSRQEGIAFLSGNGTNKPYGILTYVTGAANAARHPFGAIPVINSGDANLLKGDGFLDLFADLPSEYAANAKLYMNRTSVFGARKLKDGQGNYLWQPTYALGQPQTLGGEEVVELPDMPLVAAGNIAALYGDMEATYLIVDRVGVRVLRDPFTNKPFVMFYTTKRVGGGVYNPEPMRALKISA